jgi:hypothetical protein
VLVPSIRGVLALLVELDDSQTSLASDAGRLNLTAPGIVLEPLLPDQWIHDLLLFLRLFIALV